MVIGSTQQMGCDMHFWLAGVAYMEALASSFSFLGLASQHSLLLGMQGLQALHLGCCLAPLLAAQKHSQRVSSVQGLTINQSINVIYSRSGNNNRVVLLRTDRAKQVPQSNDATTGAAR